MIYHLNEFLSILFRHRDKTKCKILMKKNRMSFEHILHFKWIAVLNLMLNGCFLSNFKDRTHML